MHLLNQVAQSGLSADYLHLPVCVVVVDRRVSASVHREKSMKMKEETGFNESSRQYTPSLLSILVNATTWAAAAGD